MIEEYANLKESSVLRCRQIVQRFSRVVDTDVQALLRAVDGTQVRAGLGLTLQQSATIRMHLV